MDKTLQFLKELVEAHGTPGAESPVVRVLERHLKGVGTFSYDRLGSFICEKPACPARRAAHAPRSRRASCWRATWTRWASW
jgi:putative aminopeptidase FrvX